MSILRTSIAAGVRNPVVANLFMFCILAGGWLSSTRMVREVFPELSLDHIAIEVPYPSASPEDVERTVCTPIEESLHGIRGVREISASAVEGFGWVWVGLMSGEKDPQGILKEVKDRVDQITSFPPEAEKPIVRETFLRSEVVSVAIHGDVPERTLKRYAQEVQNDLLVYPEISQVSLAGVRGDEILIEISREALQAYNLTLEQVMGVVARSSLNVPAGLIRTEDEELTLRIAGQRYFASDYEDLVIIEQGNAAVRLGDIATVREGFEDAVVRGRFNGKPAVAVAVYKTPKEDSLKIARIVQGYVQSRQETLPERLGMAVWGDSSTEIESRISVLVNNGLQGLVLLFLTMWIFLDFRLSFWVAAGIPVSFAGGLILMDYYDQTINMISLFALIMVSGIIVDDSIVIAEGVHARREAGDSPALAAIEGTYRMAVPVLGSTLTSIVAFVPLLFVVGLMGRFIYVLPVVVIAALVASTFEGLWIQPAHLCFGQRPDQGYVRPTPNRFRRAVDRSVNHIITGWYRPVYRAALRHRGITLSISASMLLLTVGAWLGGRTPFILFPKEDGNVLRARVRFPEGTPVATTERAIDRIGDAARRLNNDPELQPYASGPLVQQVYDNLGEFADFLPIRGSHLGEVRIELMPSERRRIADARIIERWRHYVGAVHDALEFNIGRQQLGPTEQPIEIRLLGTDLEDMARASERIQTKLREFDGVTAVYHDLLPGKRQLQITLLPVARALGLTLEDVARQLRLGFYGGEAVRLQRGRDEVKVRVRYPEEQRVSLADLDHMRIKSPRGADVPFYEVAEVQWARGYSNIMHQDGKRRVRVLADLDERRANAAQIVHTLESGFLDSVVKDYNDLTYVFGGDRARVDESFGSLIGGFAIALLTNYAILAAVLGSYAKPLVVVAAVPFGFVGVMAGHLLFGFDISMMSLFGIVGVAGLVVNESLVLVDQINWSIREGRTVEEAVWGAGEARFRPVVLTSITDLAGLLPLLLNTSGQAQAVQPMAISLSFGLLAAAVFNLLVVPILYLLVNDARRVAFWLRYGGPYPAREVVEEEVRARELAVA